jgi:hypothetical protein
MAETLEPLAEGGADLQLVMVYRFPDAQKGRVERDNRQGLGYALAKAISDAGNSSNRGRSGDSPLAIPRVARKVLFVAVAG